MRDELAALRPLARSDWSHALLLTEVEFASDQMGSGVDWSTTTGLHDADCIRPLRRLQRKLIFARVADEPLQHGAER